MNNKYSKLTAELDGDELKISNLRARYNPGDIKIINIADIEPESTTTIGMKAKSFHYSNKIILIKDIPNSTDTIIVYTANSSVRVYRHSNPETHPLSSFLTVKSKVFFLWLSRRCLTIAYLCCVINKYKVPVKSVQFTIGNNEVARNKDVPLFTGGIKPLQLFSRGLFVDRISIKTLLNGEPEINSRIGLSIFFDDSDDRAAHYFLAKGSRRYSNKTKWYYAPIAQIRRDGFSVSIRRNGHGGLSIVRRRLEDIEKTVKFRFYESLPVSFILYHVAHLIRKVSRVQVNLYFEKLASQAEEGAINIFRKARDESTLSKNYFIIRDTAEVYDSIKDERNVVRNFTLRSYWLMYRANNIVATEVPQHMNILRSGNKYARRAPYSQTFVFLQHGITYLKPQDKTTSFKKGREGEPDYMIVSSEKERDITSDMLSIEEERFIISGMPIFDGVKYNHITTQSSDIVTIMLTWKPYEEHIQNFVESTYYKTVTELYVILKNLVHKDNIRIIAHPKFKNQMMGTEMESVLWQDTVASALEQTKLVITDYSSVCYNVFYQGGGVIFYQPDLEKYQQETGILIPHDDEYIGERVFYEEDIEKLLKKVLKGGKVDLQTLRSKRFIENYKSINEYNDGKNIYRIYEALHEINIV